MAQKYGTMDDENDVRLKVKEEGVFYYLNPSILKQFIKYKECFVRNRKDYWTLL